MRHVEHGPSKREVKGSYDFVGGEACVCSERKPLIMQK